MNQTRLLKKLEGFRKRNSNNPKFINKDIYRLLYDEDIYIIAYNAIKSNHGAETKGADGTSLDGCPYGSGRGEFQWDSPISSTSRWTPLLFN